MSYEYRNRPRYGPPIEPRDDYFTKVQKTLRMAGLIEDRYNAWFDISLAAKPSAMDQIVHRRPGPRDNSPEAEAAWHVFRQTEWLQRKPALCFVMDEIHAANNDPKAIALALMERFASPEDATLFKMFWEGR